MIYLCKGCIGSSIKLESRIEENFLVDHHKKLMFYINAINGGGAERVMVQLANLFSDRGYQVYFVTSYVADGEYRISENVYRLSLEKEQLNQSRLMRNIGRIWKLRKLCRRYESDVLISFMGEPNFRAIIATLGLKTKTVVSVRNMPEKEYGGVLGKIIGKYLLPLADGCVFQTREALEWAGPKLQNRSRVIKNIIQDDFYRSVHNEHAEDIVAVGRLCEQKNHVMLIEAFAKIKKKYPQKKLFIYGEGSLKPELENLIHRLDLDMSVMLMGQTLDVVSVLEQAGMFVMSSDYEGLPNALMEAMAVGIPCVATDCPCGGPKELIENEKNGLLISVGDKDELIDAMDKIINDKSFAHKIAQNARISARKYSKEVVFHEWEDFIINSVLGKAK